MTQLETSVAMKILKELEQDGDKVGDPNQHVLATCASHGADGSAPVALDSTGKIGRQVGWLNKHVELTQPVSYNDVVEPLSSINVTDAMKILKDVQEQAASLSDPTSFVLDSAQKA